MLEVCLTGGIAAGKSLVAERFHRLGVPVADSDVIAREVVAPGTAGLERVVAEFGSEMLADDGTLDRRALRQRVFTDDAARRRLESILHPLIRERADGQSRRWAEQGHAYALRAIPLLVETGMHRACGRILVVDAPRTVQIRRLLRRDGGSEADARAILDHQVSRWQRLAVATDVIDNGDDIDPDTGVAPQVLALHRKFTAIAARMAGRGGR